MLPTSLHFCGLTKLTLRHFYLYQSLIISHNVYQLDHNHDDIEYVIDRILFSVTLSCLVNARYIDVYKFLFDGPC